LTRRSRGGSRDNRKRDSVKSNRSPHSAIPYAGPYCGGDREENVVRKDYAGNEATTGLEPPQLHGAYCTAHGLAEHHHHAPNTEYRGGQEIGHVPAKHPDRNEEQCDAGVNRQQGPDYCKCCFHNDGIGIYTIMPAGFEKNKGRVRLHSAVYSPG
jgi:hypothetical protein